jgi:serine/threonine protein kinase
VVAIKELKSEDLAQIKPDSPEISDFIAEARVMSMIPPHPNIVPFLGVCISKKTIFIVTQFLHGGSLQKYLYLYKDSLQMKQLVEIMAGIASGMSHLAAYDIVHNDLSARNVLVEETLIRSISSAKGAKDVLHTSTLIMPKVSDFGLAAGKKKKIFKLQQVPVRWTAPEVFQDSGKFSIQSDVWSYGIVMYEVITYCANIPYKGMTNQEVADQVLGGYVLPAPKGCPEAIYEIMKSCWKKEPSSRPAFRDLYTQLIEWIANTSGGKGDFDTTSRTTEDYGAVEGVYSAVTSPISGRDEGGKQYSVLSQTQTIDNDTYQIQDDGGSSKAPQDEGTYSQYSKQPPASFYLPVPT